VVAQEPQVLADGLERATLAASVRYLDGSPAAGVPVIFSVSGSGNLLTAGSTTDSFGAASATLASTVAEIKTITVTANGVQLQTAATVRAIAPQGDPVRILNPSRFTLTSLPALRIPIGIPGDYKPRIVQLADGELLIVGFTYAFEPDEYAVFWRSADNGFTWTRQLRQDLYGGEYVPTVLADGTLVLTDAISAGDPHNTPGPAKGHIHASTDGGVTFSDLQIGPAGFASGLYAGSERQPWQLPDPLGGWDTLIGVTDINTSPDHPYLWKSKNDGMTWDTSTVPDTQGWDDFDGFFTECVTWVAPSRKLLHVIRVDAFAPNWVIPGDPPPGPPSDDSDDHMMIWQSTDRGLTWTRHGDSYGTFGTYGQYYPSFTKLRDGRLLLSYTQRGMSSAGDGLGVHGLLNYDDGETWDFQHDIIWIDDQSPPGEPSGGGFGNSLQLNDGALLTPYSYRDASGNIDVEVVRWSLPQD